MTVPIYILIILYKGLFFPHPCQHTYLLIFDKSHSNRCEIISDCGFNLHFPDVLFLILAYIIPFFTHLLIVILYGYYKDKLQSFWIVLSSAKE